MALSEEIRWRVPSLAFNVLHNYSCHNTNLCTQCVSLQPTPFFVKYGSREQALCHKYCHYESYRKGSFIAGGGELAGVVGGWGGGGGLLLINYFGVQ